MTQEKTNIEKGREFLNNLEKVIKEKNLSEIIRIKKEVLKLEWWEQAPIYQINELALL